MREWKRAMSYMWSGKAIRGTFGCGFELFGNGGMMLLLAVAMSVPWLVTLIGFDVSASVCKWAYVVAFFGHMMMQVIVVEVPITVYWVSGKGMGGIPYAKWMLTKGIVSNLFIYYVCGLLLMLGIHGINMAVGVLDASWVDELIFLPGLFLLLEAVFQCVGSLIRRDGTARGYFGVSFSAAVVVIPTVLGEINISVGTACLIQLLLVAVGVVLMYCSLLWSYKKRSGENR